MIIIEVKNRVTAGIAHGGDGVLPLLNGVEKKRGSQITGGSGIRDEGSLTILI